MGPGRYGVPEQSFGHAQLPATTWDNRFGLPALKGHSGGGEGGHFGVPLEML
jgi:hypothetical protein